jgi:hypothetical protein
MKGTTSNGDVRHGYWVMSRVVLKDKWKRFDCLGMAEPRRRPLESGV